MNIKKKLYSCLLLNFFTLSAVVGTTIAFNSDAKYFRLGPQPDLLVISVLIDTYSKYALLMIIITIVNIGECLAHEIGQPILFMRIYNPDKKRITDFSKNELQISANLFYFITNIIYIFLTLVAITQIDIAVYSVLIREITTSIAIRILLNEKTFSSNIQPLYHTSVFDDLDSIQPIV